MSEEILITELTNNLKELDIDKPTYKRQKLTILENAIGKCDKLNELIANLIDDKSSILFKVNKMDIYHYNCESVEDFGWGCAWRCIQSYLSTLDNSKVKDLDLSFNNLFMKYGNRELLDNIYLRANDMTELPNYLIDKQYAPHETEYGWAEPFIAYLIFNDLGIKGNLMLVNAYPQFAYAPKEVFSKTFIYSEFKKFLIDHFQKENPSPIMVDDSVITMLIIGFVARGDDKLCLIVADPHVTEPEKGIYLVTLDEEGDFDISFNTQKTKNGKKFIFKNKSWMIYYN